jgi:predicted Zn-dependent peptidase
LTPAPPTLNFDTLPNGFRVVSEAMPGMGSVAVGIWVLAGGRHETEAQNGIAHFLEHMAFKGTKRRTALQIAEEIEDVGGYINAYTSREVTAYYVRVLPEDLALAVDVVGDILLEPTFDEAEIETERGVILQEIGQALDTPDDVIFDWLQERAYADQPLGRTILGAAERVRAFSRADLFDFVGAHYGPGQMILAAAGAVDHDALMKLAERQFGHLAESPRTTATPATFTGGERREIKGLEQVHFALAMPSPGYTAPDVYVSQVFATALGGGMSSRLFQELREKRGLCYTIFAQAAAYAETGLTTLYAGTSADQIDDLATLTVTEMKKAAEEMTEAEIARARAQLKAGLVMGLESPSARAERLARMVGVWNRVPPVTETVARIDAVTRADVLAFGQALCTGGQAAMALYGPAERAPALAALQDRMAA